MKHSPKKNAGFSLLEVTLVGALLAAVSVGAIRFFNQMGKAGVQMNATRTATGLRSSLLSLVNSPKAWQRTILEQKAGALECLAKGAAGDCQGKGGPLTIYTSAGEPQFDLTPDAGFTMGGAPCEGYVSTGNRACPFRVDIEWEPICSAPAPAKCPNPQVRIVGTIRYRPAEQTRGLAFNEGNYSVNIIRGQPLSNAGEFCESIGAKWIEDEQRCDTKAAFCAAIGGTFDVGADACGLPIEMDCDSQAVNRITIVDGAAQADCIEVNDDFSQYDYQMSSRPWSDPELRKIPQDEVKGCATQEATAVADANGVACRQDRPAGTAGTCYYRVPMSGNTPDYGKAGWYRVGTGYCRGAIYVNDSYTAPFSPF